MTLLAWIDTKAIGLEDYRQDYVLEIAMVLTDQALQPIPGASLSLIVRPPLDWEDKMTEEVRRAYSRNGLLRAVPTGLPLAEAQLALIDLAKQHTDRSEKLRPCGRSVRRHELARIGYQFPHFARRLDPDPIDLTEARRFLTEVCGRDDIDYTCRGKGRAMADLEDTLDEAVKIRDELRRTG